ncbi:MAG: adenylate cyclase, partial [bacterium]
MKQKKTKFLLPISVGVFLLFISITLALFSILTWRNYHENSKLMLKTASKLMGKTSEKVTQKINLIFEPLFVLGEITTQLNDISTPLNFHLHPLSKYLMNIIEQYPQIFAVYMGYDNARFYKIISMQGSAGKRTGKRIHAPKETHFSIMQQFFTKSGKKVQLWQFLNKDRLIIGSWVNDKNITYDPRSRPWYKIAINTDVIRKTKPYIYSNLQEPGVTLSKRFDGSLNGVFGVDITLSNISNFLKKQKITPSTKMLFFNREGLVTAHPDIKKMIVDNGYSIKEQIKRNMSLKLSHIEDLKDETISAIYNKFKTNPESFKNPLIFSIKKVDYIAQITRIPSKYGTEEFFLMITPAKEVVEPITKLHQQNLIFSLILLICLIPFMFYLSRKVSQPIMNLVREANKIRDFDLEQTFQDKSNIKEFRILAKSVNTMKHSLEVFGRYVPKALIQQMIQSGIDPQLGGEKKPLTIMFTDIANFTSTSEILKPEELMLLTSDYFKDMSRAIINNHGTIDKYIGDAIMAFWNAPMDDADHTLHA